MSGVRHFTVTTFVSAMLPIGGATLLHWHRKVGLWLPPGGHIEVNEDPIEAARREALEETGIAVDILPTSDPFAYADPPQLAAPVTIMVEPIGGFGGEAAHQHIDLIYFSRPQDDASLDAPSGSWRWVTRQQLEEDAPLTLDDPQRRISARLSEDVRVLGLAAIDHVLSFEEQRP